MDTRNKILEIVNVFGSIASITGISLLWLKGSMEFDTVFFAKVTAAVIVGFGCLTLVVAATYSLYVHQVKKVHWLWRVVFFSLGVPIACWLIFFFAVVCVQGVHRVIDNVAAGKPIVEPRRDND